MKFLYVFMIFLPLISACTRGPIAKSMWDAEVMRLCEIDGGIKIYERVKLPPDKFNIYGEINFSIPEEINLKSNDEYYYISNIKYYKEWNPVVSRRQYQIVRREDSKVLGELILYGRGGGDLIGPWHGSSFTCPDANSLPNFESSVFLK